MNTKKKNSFRCFAIYQIGLNGQKGEFLTVHKRGCLKTFNREKDELIEVVNQHFDGQSGISHGLNKDQFEFKNWIGIKKQNNDNTFYFLLLCHQNVRKNEAFKQLATLQTWNNEKYKNIDPSKLEDDINKLEQKYGEPDGYLTDEGEDEKQRNLYQQQQLEKQQQKQQQQQQQQQPQQYQQQQQQQRQSQQQFNTPQKGSQHRQSSAQKSKSPINKVLNANYTQINLIVSTSFQLNIKAEGKTQVEDRFGNRNQVAQNVNHNDEQPIQEKNPKPKTRQKQQFMNQEALKQMEESNKLKQADALIRNSIVGALTSGTLALII